MNSKFTYISLALALALSACRSDDTPPPAPEITEENPTYMSFSFTMENPNGQTKATRGDAPNLDNVSKWEEVNNEYKASLFDIRILGDEFTAVILDENNGKVGNFKILSYTKSVTDQTVTYFLHGSFAPDDTDKYPDTESLKDAAANLKLMVFANTPTDPLSSISELGNLEFEYIGNPKEEGDQIDENFPAIPMWGVCQVDFTNLRQGSYTEINANHPCHLLRAMAKVSVQLKLGNNQKDRVKLVSLTLNKYNSKGYVVAGREETAQEWTKLTSTGKLEFANTLREHTLSLVKDNNGNPTPYTCTDITQVEGQDNITFYLPEIVNKGDALLTVNPTEDDKAAEKECLELTLTYTVDGNEKVNHLYFTQYSGGGPVIKDGNYQLGLWDVVRNHVYEFNITGVQDSKISVDARVKDWQYHKEVQPLEPLE